VVVVVVRDLAAAAAVLAAAAAAHILLAVLEVFWVAAVVAETAYPVATGVVEAVVVAVLPLVDLVGPDSSFSIGLRGTNHEICMD
jgi:hypothetical protein